MAEQAKDCAETSIQSSSMETSFPPCINKRVFEECEAGNVSYIAQYLESVGHNVNIQTEVSRETLLHICARKRFYSIASKILEHPDVNIDLSDIHGNSCLHLAAQCGHYEMVRKVIQKGANVNQTNDADDTALHLAVKSGFKKCVWALLAKNAAIQLANTAGKTALDYAMDNKDFKAFELMVGFKSSYLRREIRLLDILINMKRVDWLKYALKYRYFIPSEDNDCISALHQAIRFNYKEGIQYLLSQGVSCRKQLDVDGYNAIQMAVGTNNISVLRMILPYCEDINQLQCKDQPVLHTAVCCDDFEMVALLLKHGANINVRNDKGETGLHVTAENESLHRFEYLSRWGADHTLRRNEDEKTALDVFFENAPDTVIDHIIPSPIIFDSASFRRALILLACKNDTEPLGYSILSSAILERLKTEYPNDFDELLCCSKELDNTGDSAIEKAVQANNLGVLRMILPYCKDINQVKHDDAPPILHTAVCHDNLEMVDLLFEHGANIDARNTSGETGMHLAATLESYEMFCLLSSRGADHTARRNDGETPLEIFFFINPNTVVDRLLSSKDILDSTSFRQLVMRLACKKSTETYELGDCILTDDVLHSLITEHAEDFNGLLYCLSLYASSDILRYRVIDFWENSQYDRNIIKSNPTWKTNILIRAARCGNAPFLRFLASFYAIRMQKISKTKTVGHEALEDAVKNTKGIKSVPILLEAGVKPQGLPGKYLASKRHNEVSKLLFEHGASMKLTIQPYKLPYVQFAIVHGNFEMAYFLMDKGCSNMNHVAKFGFTILHDAVWSRNTSILKVVCEKQISMDAKLNSPDLPDDLDGSTALHLAVRLKHTPSVLLLITHGANVRMLDSRGKTPLDFAINNRLQSLVAILISAGAKLVGGSEPPMPYEHESFQTAEGQRTRSILSQCGYSFAHAELDNAKNGETRSSSHNPLPLQNACAQVIRTTLKPNAWVSIDKLSLPRTLVDYVTFELMNEAANDDEAQTEWRDGTRLDIHSKR